MEENKLDLLTIYQLIENTPYSFYIPSYQRGYRWTERQVTDLLDDILEFGQNKNAGEYYCLQPVVVKPKEESWEVIDGQQRLTTIFLLLKYFNSRLTEEFRKALYKLTYETREGSSQYLDNLDPGESNKNVDYYHINQAYTTIRDWFAVRSNIINEFETTLLNLTKIIWYEVNEDTDSIDIFTRLNIGKIPLNAAELIKALFLFRDNFIGNDQTKLLRQLEIAGEWDRIEATLRDKEFWGFINNGKDGYDNHIEFIFDLIGNKANQDKDYTFRYFHKRFEANKDIEDAWKEVKDYFLTFQEWYNDKDLFHLIGFLITVGEKVRTIKSLGIDKTKKAFKELLKDNVKRYVKVQVAELSYSDVQDRKDIRNILLLFNLVSITNNRKANYKFQFGRYKAENWDLEHIHSVKSYMPEREEFQRDWLNEVMSYTTDESLRTRISVWHRTERKLRTDTFDKIYDDVLRMYSEGNLIEDRNDISNLTLLDANTNRGYKNAIFPIKRNKIVERDQSGTFIPLCTKNVFLKYYNKSVKQTTLWGKEDRDSYLQSIIMILEEYLPIQNSHNIQS